MSRRSTFGRRQPRAVDRCRPAASALDPNPLGGGPYLARPSPQGLNPTPAAGPEIPGQAPGLGPGPAPGQADPPLGPTGRRTSPSPQAFPGGPGVDNPGAPQGAGKRSNRPGARGLGRNNHFGDKQARPGGRMSSQLTNGWRMTRSQGAGAGGTISPPRPVTPASRQGATRERSR